MLKSSPLLKLHYAAEAAGYATAGCCETSAEWDATAVYSWRRRPAMRLAVALASVSTTLTTKLLALLLFVV
jgi:hypothetical protein